MENGNNSGFSRRGFILRSMTFASAAIAGSSLLGGLARTASAAPAKAKAKEIPLPAGTNEVPATDPVATAIGYVSDVSKVDKKTNPQFKAGSNCANCALYVKSNEGWGKCTMISTGLVRANGWCRSYSKKA